MLTDLPFQKLADHIVRERHALAGATIAASAALGCSLGEACVWITERAAPPSQPERAQLVMELDRITSRLLALADEDAAAIGGYESIGDLAAAAQARDRLCALPLEIGTSAAEAAEKLQTFRAGVVGVQDDLEMAIVLLTGASRAAALLLDSNLRIWTDMVGSYEWKLGILRAQIDSLRPVESVRQK
jgi:hypothetical protein